MPEPKYLEHDDDDDADDAENVGGAKEGEGEAGKTAAPTPTGLAAWMPLMCQAAADDIVRSAVTNVSLCRVAKQHQSLVCLLLSAKRCSETTTSARTKVTAAVESLILAPVRNS